MKEKVLMLLACLWLGIGSPSSAEVTTPATVLGA